MRAIGGGRGWLVALGLVGGVLVACAAPAGPALPGGGAAPEFEVTPQKGEDQVTVTVAAGRALVDVTSASGIGSAAISLTAGEMPERLAMRFHLKGLEQMTFAYGDTVLTLSVPSGDGGQALRSAAVEDQPVEVTPRGPYWMEVKRVAPGDSGDSGYFEVTAPQDFHDAGATMFFVAWIDFYR